MAHVADLRPLIRFVACLTVGGCVLWVDFAAAQGAAPSALATSLPSFTWPQATGPGESRWAGSYARMSTGFEVSSSRHFGSYAGPTVGFEGGRMWQDDRLVYGITGGFDYLSVLGGGATPRVGGLAYTRDFSGALQMKVGTLVTPDVLVYAKVGAAAVHEQLRFGPTAFSPTFSRDDIAVRPEARVGVEWAVTDRLSVAVETGVTGRGLR